jgi:hypothetical protein
MKGLLKKILEIEMINIMSYYIMDRMSKMTNLNEMDKILEKLNVYKLT